MNKFDEDTSAVAANSNEMKQRNKMELAKSPAFNNTNESLPSYSESQPVVVVMVDSSMPKYTPRPQFLRMTLGIGITHIILSVVTTSFWIGMYCYLKYRSYVDPLVVPFIIIFIVLPLLGIPTGIVGILCYKYKHKSKGLAVAHMVLSIICIFFIGPFCFSFFVLTWFLLISFLQLAVSIWSLVMACISLFNCCKCCGFQTEE